MKNSPHFPMSLRKKLPALTPLLALSNYRLEINLPPILPFIKIRKSAFLSLATLLALLHVDMCKSIPAIPSLSIESLEMPFIY